MLSPSHPGPDKATHFSMRDRTVVRNRSVGSPVSVVSQLVGIKRCSTSACDSANDGALLATDQSAKHCSGAEACGGRQLIAMLIPE